MVYAMFVCIITCVLFIVSTVRMVSVKRWMKSQIGVLESKKQELDEMILSASDMVHELNHVSDYVITTVEQKNNDLADTLKTADEKLFEFKEIFESNDKNKVIDFPSMGISQAVVHSKKNEIEELYNDGYSVSDIARELGIGKGEIELMLGITERYLSLAN